MRLLPHIIPTAKDLGLQDKGIAREYDRAVVDKEITLKEGLGFIESGSDGAGHTSIEVDDYDKIAKGAGHLFVSAWNRASFDDIVEQVLNYGPTVALGKQLEKSLASMRDATDLAYAAAGIEKMRVNVNLPPSALESLHKTYYHKLIQLDRVHQPSWRAKEAFDDAFHALMIGGPSQDQVNKLATALGEVTGRDVDSLPYAIRRIEKLRANGVANKEIHGTLYKVLQQFEGQKSNSALESFQQQVSLIKSGVNLIYSKQNYNGLELKVGALDALLVSGKAASGGKMCLEPGVFTIRSKNGPTIKVGVTPGMTDEQAADKICNTINSRHTGVLARIDGRDYKNRLVIKLQEVQYTLPRDNR